MAGTVSLFPVPGTKPPLAKPLGGLAPPLGRPPPPPINPPPVGLVAMTVLRLLIAAVRFTNADFTGSIVPLRPFRVLFIVVRLLLLVDNVVVFVPNAELRFAIA